MANGKIPHGTKSPSFIKEGFLCVCMFIASVSFSLPSYAQQKYDEGHVRAVVLFRIMRFVEWNKLSEATLNLCAFGKGNSLDHLEILNGKPMPNLARNIAPKDGNPPNNTHTNNLILKTIAKKKTDDTSECHIILIGKLDSPFEEPTTSKSSQLVVCDGCSYPDTRTSVELVTINNKTRFNVDLEAAKRSQIRISSDLLALANQVRGTN